MSTVKHVYSFERSHIHVDFSQKNTILLRDSKGITR